MSPRAPRRDGARVLLSVLDRLIDDAPDELRDKPLSVPEAEAMLRRAIRRDLEALLNARRRWRSWPEAYTELQTSPLGFGIPDFAAGAFNTAAAREEMRRDVEDTIRRFEPRFVSVRVQLVDDEAHGALQAVLRFRVEALLHADPAPEPIVFDSVVDATTAEIVVRQDDSRV